MWFSRCEDADGRGWRPGRLGRRVARSSQYVVDWAAAAAAAATAPGDVHCWQSDNVAEPDSQHDTGLPRHVRVAAADHCVFLVWFNPLMGTGTYSATSSWYTGRWWVGCYIWYSEEGLGSPLRPLLAVPNVTAHPSTASVPITVLLYSSLLLCGFNVPIKGLIYFLHWAEED